MTKRRIALLGSTGSIGVNTLKVIDRHPGRFEVAALSAYNNFQLLQAQIKKYRPSHVAVGPQGLEHFRRTGLKGVKLWPIEECSQLASLKNVDVVVLAMSGARALMPFLAALRQGKTVAPANKEA